jgi:hypothetical protein
MGLDSYIGVYSQISLDYVTIEYNAAYQKPKRPVLIGTEFFKTGVHLLDYCCRGKSEKSPALDPRITGSNSKPDKA